MTTFWLLCWVPQSQTWELRMSCVADSTDEAIDTFAHLMPNLLGLTTAWAVSREDNLKHTVGQFVGEVTGKVGAA